MSEPPLYPAGEFVLPQDLTPPVVAGLIARWRQLPERIKAATDGWSENQLDTRFRNWSVRQIVHHLADSHMNAFLRIKFALTEELPTIKPYDESLWVETPDARTWPIADSLEILRGLHARSACLLESLTPQQFARSYRHPQYDAIVRIDEALAQYVWHGDHHLAQIQWVKSNRLRSG